MATTNLPTVTSVGYGGSIDEVAWSADVGPSLGVAFGVRGEVSWRVTPDLAGDRRVLISEGLAYGWGVFDTLPAPVTHTFDSVASGSRWDVLFVRRTWAGGGGTTSLVSIPVGAGNSAPANRALSPGVQVDQPLAMVRLVAGQSTPAEIIDLRMWPGNGGITAVSTRALEYISRPGSTVRIGSDLWTRIMDSSGSSSWSRTSLNSVPLLGAGGTLAGGFLPVGADVKLQAGSVAQDTDTSAFARITFPIPFPNGLISIVLTNGDSGAVNATLFEVAGSAGPGGGVPGGGWGIGNRTDVVYRLYGPSNGVLTPLTTRRHRVNWVALGW